MKKIIIFFFIIILFSCDKKEDNVLQTNEYHDTMETFNSTDDNIMSLYGFLLNRYYYSSNESLGISYYFREQNIVERTIWAYETFRITGTYKIEHDHGVPFINFYWENSPEERFLLLGTEYFIALYSDNSEPEFFGYNNNRYVNGHRLLRSNSITQVASLTTSSTLIEEDIYYYGTPERLGTHINRVWAVNGGIGEKLFIELPSLSLPIIFISTGYVHFSRPYLYLYNSRPKKISINGVEFELEDTPNYQIIRGVSPWGIMEIEVLEIYPGTRYDHMCINSILVLSDM